jgi:pimeloyl-ACP methyl ester carboxylesterase
MGANIASIYAGTRPARVRQVSMLDFLGLNRSSAADAPLHMSKWLSNLNGNHQLRAYESQAALAKRLRQSNPRLSEQRAAFLAQHVSRRRSDGLFEMACDPWHKVPSPNLYKIEDVMNFWRNISCPVQMQIADNGFVVERFGNDSIEYRERTGCFADLSIVHINNSSHNLQHDQPEQVAKALENFLLRD